MLQMIARLYARRAISQYNPNYSTYERVNKELQHYSKLKRCLLRRNWKICLLLYYSDSGDHH
jgi:hypothetical protein